MKLVRQKLKTLSVAEIFDMGESGPDGDDQKECNFDRCRVPLRFVRAVCACMCA